MPPTPSPHCHSTIIRPLPYWTCAESTITGFKHTRDAAFQLRPAATATFVRTTFSANEVSQHSDPLAPEIVPIGPDGGLRSPPATSSRRSLTAADDHAAAVSYHACRFESRSALPAHSVAVDTARCRVYSDGYGPRVYDAESGRVSGPWELVEDPAAAAAEVPAGSPEDIYQKRGFPREVDVVFSELVQARFPYVK